MKFLIPLALFACALTMAACGTASTPAPTRTDLPPTDAPTAARPTVSPSETAFAPTPIAERATVSPSPTSLASATPTRVATRFVIPQRDVTYCNMDGVDLKMDLYPPAAPSARPAPVIVYVHGGGWQTGDKREGEGVALASEISGRGYFLVSLNYRLAPKYKFPAQIEDVKCAIRHLRANSAAYHIDPDHIGAMGSSAGGHLVALLGCADKNAGFDHGPYADQSSRVQAVVDLYGPTDLTKDFPQRQANNARNVFGANSADDPILAKASPVTYVSKSAPPFLIIHGDKDSLVPPVQSQRLYDRLQATGNPVKLIIVKNAEHGLAPAGGAPSPSLAELAQIVIAFFDQYLKTS